MGNSLEAVFARKKTLFYHFFPTFGPKILVITVDPRKIFEKFLDN